MRKTRSDETDYVIHLTRPALAKDSLSLLSRSPQMAGTVWRLKIRMLRSPQDQVGTLKTVLGVAKPVTVSNDGPDVVVVIDYETKSEADEAAEIAQDADLDARCRVDELPVRDRLTEDR